jgi:hypothetical protein
MTRRVRAARAAISGSTAASTCSRVSGSNTSEFCGRVQQTRDEHLIQDRHRSLLTRQSTSTGPLLWLANHSTAPLASLAHGRVKLPHGRVNLPHGRGNATCPSEHKGCELRTCEKSPLGVGLVGSESLCCDGRFGVLTGACLEVSSSVTAWRGCAVALELAKITSSSACGVPAGSPVTRESNA